MQMLYFCNYFTYTLNYNKDVKIFELLVNGEHAYFSSDPSQKKKFFRKDEKRFEA